MLKRPDLGANVAEAGLEQLPDGGLVVDHQDATGRERLRFVGHGRYPRAREAVSRAGGKTEP
jgi:hypothetical protein